MSILPQWVFALHRSSRKMHRRRRHVNDQHVCDRTAKARLRSAPGGGISASDSTTGRDRGGSV